MNDSKVLIAAFLITSILVIGQPTIRNVKASEIIPTLPAVVFIQNKNENMIVNHNFDLDSKIYIPMDKGMDNGFYVTLPNN